MIAYVKYDMIGWVLATDGITGAAPDGAAEKPGEVRRIVIGAAGERQIVGQTRTSSRRLQIFRAEASMLGQPREHPRADLFVVVKCEHDIGPALAGKRSMRT